MARTGVQVKGAGTKTPRIEEGKWYVADMGRIIGPMPWKDVKSMADKAQVTPYAQIREESWKQWAPIIWYLRVKTKGEMEIEGLIPSRYDAMFYLGVFMFMVGIIGFVIQPVVGILLILLSILVEVKALQLESKHKGKAATRTIGNIIAMLWIVLQIGVTVLMVGMVLF
ncbi:MAG: hypothetical protein JSV09_00370 [Thermoplasmata archaeon]|nr:MAG: hypothetical protein JSV09_00370 [Thermoplasmata archaeon]